MTRTYTFTEAVKHLLKSKKLTMTVQDLGSSMETYAYYRDQPMQHEVSLFDVRLQGNKISTQEDTFDYRRQGSVEPYPTASEILYDLTNFSVYWSDRTPEGFVAWVQEWGWDHYGIGTEEAVKKSQKRWEEVGGEGTEPQRMRTLDEILAAWQAEWAAIKKLEDAIGRDVLKFLMEAER